MSRTFSINSGSGDSLKVALWWRRNPKAHQMRLTIMRLRPVARASERVLQCVAPAGVVSNVGGDDLFDLGVGHGARCARPWLIKQPVDPVPGEASAPLADGRLRQAQASGNRLVVLARRAAKHDTRSTRQLRRGARPPRHRLEVLPLSLGQHDGNRWASCSRSVSSNGMDRSPRS